MHLFLGGLHMEKSVFPKTVFYWAGVTKVTV